MAADWREVRFGDLVADGLLEISDGYRVRNEELGPEGIPFVRGGDIGDGWINTDTEDHIRAEFAERVRSKLAQPGDVAFITKGTVGRAGRLRAGQPAVVFAPQVAYWRVRARDVLDSGFLFYFIRSREFQAALDGVKTHGSMVADYVSISQQHDFTFQLPDIGSQRAIAHILGRLDDKIELNRRMNETLEAIARTLFKSWFVDFDPVRAKADGRDPGLPKPISDLFPDSFEESELGEIPKGWRSGTVNDIAETNAKTLSRRDALDVIDYIEISEVMRGEIGTVVRYERGAEPSRARRCLRHGDSVLSTVRPDRGAYFLCLNPPRTLIASTGFVVLSPRDGNWTFLYSALTRHEIGEKLGRLADGGAYPAIRPEAIGALTFVIPKGSQIVSAFQTLAVPLFERVQQNRTEAKILATLRDTLLPKLISGELRVPDAERIMGRNA
jgi:type I restriction enzyme S subunit